LISTNSIRSHIGGILKGGNTCYTNGEITSLSIPESLDYDSGDQNGKLKASEQRPECQKHGHTLQTANTHTHTQYTEYGGTNIEEWRVRNKGMATFG
jgi:hypothetical protein